MCPLIVKLVDAANDQAFMAATPCVGLVVIGVGKVVVGLIVFGVGLVVFGVCLGLCDNKLVVFGVGLVLFGVGMVVFGVGRVEIAGPWRPRPDIFIRPGAVRDQSCKFT